MLVRWSRFPLRSATSSRPERKPIPRRSSSPGAGWRRFLAAWRRVDDSRAGDAIGAICLFLILWMSTFAEFLW